MMVDAVRTFPASRPVEDATCDAIAQLFSGRQRCLKVRGCGVRTALTMV